MTTRHTELYDALISAGADEVKARAAASGLPTSDQPVTKADLKAGLAELNASLTWRLVGLGAVGVAVLTLVLRIPG